MPGRKRVLIQDEFDTRSPAEVWWFLHTPAEVKTDGRAAVLSLHEKNLTARILSPAGATFTVMDAKPLPACPNPTVQNTNAGVRKLAIRLENVTRERIAVVLEPELSPSNLPSIVPLAQVVIGVREIANIER